MISKRRSRSKALDNGGRMEASPQRDLHIRSFHESDNRLDNGMRIYDDPPCLDNGGDLRASSQRDLYVRNSFEWDSGELEPSDGHLNPVILVIVPAGVVAVVIAIIWAVLGAW